MDSPQPDEPASSEPTLATQSALTSPSETRTPPFVAEETRKGSDGDTATQVLPARMLNEFVYCPRLFYYEFVEGVFLESADTKSGTAIHRKVDSGNGAMVKPGEKAETIEPPAPGDVPHTVVSELETIHSRSVEMGSPRLNVLAKMDLVETRVYRDDLFTAVEVCPVDYKLGSPLEGKDRNEIWDTDKMQLGVQALILRDNGYECKEGIIYYRATKQRVHLPITSDLESWVIEQIAAARRTVGGGIPAPLLQSNKCIRCSLAPVCLPDETRLLATLKEESAVVEISQASKLSHPRRLYATRADTRVLYLNTHGLRVGCSQGVLQVKEKEKTLETIRLHDLSHISVFGNIQISTQAIQALCENEIPISYFSGGGWFYGITRGHSLKNVFLRMEQFRVAADAALSISIAKAITGAKIRNQRTLLMRNHIEPGESTLLRLRQASDDALACKSLAELLGVEGAAAHTYFQHFSGMLKTEDELAPQTGSPQKTPTQLQFNFARRNRRPPTDPVNAMLSLAYSLLSKDCTLACLAVGFDPYIGFYHQPRFGRAALSLDLMEEFRPVIADSTVVTCINNRIIQLDDFVRAGDAVNLSVSGRKRFFQAYETRMSTLINHPLFDYKISYRATLELQARILARVLIGETDEYIPLVFR